MVARRVRRRALARSRAVENLHVLVPQAEVLAHAVRVVHDHVLHLHRIVGRDLGAVVDVVERPEDLDDVAHRRLALQGEHGAHRVLRRRLLRLDAEADGRARAPFLLSGERVLRGGGVGADAARASLGGEPPGRDGLSRGCDEGLGSRLRLLAGGQVNRELLAVCTAAVAVLLEDVLLGVLVAVGVAVVAAGFTSLLNRGGDEGDAALLYVVQSLLQGAVEPSLVPDGFPRLLRVRLLEIEHLILAHPPERVLAEEDHERLVLLSHVHRLGRHLVLLEVNLQTGPERVSGELRPHNLRLLPTPKRDVRDGVRVVVGVVLLGLVPFLLRGFLLVRVDAVRRGFRLFGPRSTATCRRRRRQRRGGVTQPRQARAGVSRLHRRHHRRQRRQRGSLRGNRVLKRGGSSLFAGFRPRHLSRRRRRRRRDGSLRGHLHRDELRRGLPPGRAKSLDAVQRRLLRDHLHAGGVPADGWGRDEGTEGGRRGAGSRPRERGHGRRAPTRTDVVGARRPRHRDRGLEGNADGVGSLELVRVRQPGANPLRRGNAPHGRRERVPPRGVVHGGANRGRARGEGPARGKPLQPFRVVHLQRGETAAGHEDAARATRVEPLDEIAKDPDAPVRLPIEDERLRLVWTRGVERRDRARVLGEQHVPRVSVLGPDEHHPGFDVGNAKRGGGDGPVRPSVSQPLELADQVAYDGHAVAVALEQRGGRLDEHPRRPRARLHQPEHLLQLGRHGILAPALAPRSLELGGDDGRGEKVGVRG